MPCAPRHLLSRRVRAGLSEGAQAKGELQAGGLTEEGADAVVHTADKAVELGVAQPIRELIALLEVQAKEAKADTAALKAELKADTAALKAELKADTARLEGKSEADKAELRADTAALKADIRLLLVVVVAVAVASPLLPQWSVLIAAVRGFLGK